MIEIIHVALTKQLELSDCQHDVMESMCCYTSSWCRLFFSYFSSLVFFCYIFFSWLSALSTAAGNSTFSKRQLRVQLHVNASAALPSDVQPPQLTGQIEASADEYGQILIEDVRLTAAPGTYFIYIALPDYPDVSLHTCVMSEK